MVAQWGLNWTLMCKWLAGLKSPLIGGPPLEVGNSRPWEFRTRITITTAPRPSARLFSQPEELGKIIGGAETHMHNWCVRAHLPLFAVLFDSALVVCNLLRSTSQSLTFGPVVGIRGEVQVRNQKLGGVCRKG